MVSQIERGREQPEPSPPCGILPAGLTVLIFLRAFLDGASEPARIETCAVPPLRTSSNLGSRLSYFEFSPPPEEAGRHEVYELAHRRRRKPGQQPARAWCPRTSERDRGTLDIHQWPKATSRPEYRPIRPRLSLPMFPHAITAVELASVRAFFGSFKTRKKKSGISKSLFRIISLC